MGTISDIARKVPHVIITLRPRASRTEKWSYRQFIVYYVNKLTLAFRSIALICSLVYMFLLAIAFCTELGTALYSLAQQEVYVPTVGEVVKADAMVNTMQGKPNGMLADWLLNPSRAIVASKLLWAVLAVIPLLLAYAAGSYVMGKLSLLCMQYWEPSMKNKPVTTKKVSTKFALVTEIVPPQWEEVPNANKMF